MARTRGRHARSSRRASSLLVIAAVVLGTAVLGWWSTRLLADLPAPAPAADSPASPGSPANQSGAEDGAHDGSHDGGQGGTGDGGDASDDPAAPADDKETNVDAAVDQCAAQLATVERAVRVGRDGVEQWSAHVRARTDMLEGRISEARMDAIYERTTRSGHLDQERFSAAVSQVAASPCRALDRLEPRTGGARSDCVTRTGKAVAALEAATSTMEEWQHHLHHMESYEDGGMRTGKAMALWIKAWRKAPEGISTFAHRRVALEAAPSCTG